VAQSADLGLTTTGPSVTLLLSLDFDVRKYDEDPDFRLCVRPL